MNIRLLIALLLVVALQTAQGATYDITTTLLSRNSLKLTGGNTYVFSFSSIKSLIPSYLSTSWPSSSSTSGFSIFSSTDIYGNPPIESFAASPGNSADLLSVKLNYGQGSQEYKNYGTGSYVWGSGANAYSGQNGTRLNDVDPSGNLTITMVGGNADISNITVWSSFGTARRLYTASYDLPNPVPEPSSLSFLALGGLALAINRRRRA